MTTVHVFDTYATTSKGKIMHFDVLITELDSEKALNYAQQWLQSIGEGDAQLTSKNCVFCHSDVAPPQYEAEINQQGYAILKMEGCPT